MSKSKVGDTFKTPKGRTVLYYEKYTPLFGTVTTYHYQWLDAPKKHLEISNAKGQFKKKISPSEADMWIDASIKSVEVARKLG